MSNENQNQVLQAVSNAQQHHDFGELKQFLLHTFTNANASEQFGMTEQERFTNFIQFRGLYNLLLRLEMHYNPDITGVNLL